LSDDAPKNPAARLQAMEPMARPVPGAAPAPAAQAASDSSTAALSAGPEAEAGQDLLSRLAWRLCTQPDVTPQLGLRFAPTPDLPDDETARWRREWRAEPVK